VLGDTLYVIGGADRSPNLFDSVETAPIQPDGSIGSFAIPRDGKLVTAHSMYSADVLAHEAIARDRSQRAHRGAQPVRHPH
jgi:hypothetical protein